MSQCLSDKEIYGLHAGKRGRAKVAARIDVIPEEALSTMLVPVAGKGACAKCVQHPYRLYR